MAILLFLLFIVVPVVELAVIIQVGQVLGVLPTVVLLLVVSVVGAWMVRREGTRAWSAFRLALARGRVPTTEVIDGALLLFGGALLLTPGFATDALGLLLVLPPTRHLANRTIRARVRGRVLDLGATRAGPSGRPRGGQPRRSGPPRPPTTSSSPDSAVDVEVVDVRRADQEAP